jgi:hypothetical protein
MAAAKTWEVSISVDGENVLTIGHNHLAGAGNIGEHADVVRTCARHLLSFIGDDESCPGHVASRSDPKICGLCGLHIDSLLPDDELPF